MEERSTQGEEKKPLILLIEDDEADVFLFRRALARLHYVGDVRNVNSSGEARRYLENTGWFANAEYFRIPNLIVCDFKLAGGTALEFLQWARSDPRFKDIPLVMLSGVPSAMDKGLFAGMAVTAFLRKTGDPTSLGENLEPLLPVKSKG